MLYYLSLSPFTFPLVAFGIESSKPPKLPPQSLYQENISKGAPEMILKLDTLQEIPAFRDCIIRDPRYFVIILKH